MKKEYGDEFVRASWTSPEEVTAFIAQATEITTADILVLLDILTSKKAVVGSQEQERRTQVFLALAKKVTDRNLFEPYLRALKCEDKHLRAVLSEVIPLVENNQSRSKICELLKSPDVQLRKSVGQILLKIHDQNMFRHIGELFQDRNFAGRSEAIDLAGALPGHYSAELFKTVLASGRSHEKVKVLKFLTAPDYLGGNQRLIATIVEPALADTEETVVVEAIAAFAAVCTEDEYFNAVGSYLYADNVRLVKATLEGLRRFTSERTISALERKLYTGPNMIRMAVLDTIEAIGASCIYKVLLKALEHKHTAVRERASAVLTKLTHDGKIDMAVSLLWLLRSEDPAVKQFAFKLVAAVPDKKWLLWSEVFVLIRKEDWWTRQRLVGTLVEMAGEGLTPLILTYLNDPLAVIRRFALDVLHLLKSQQSLKAVVQIALHDVDWWVREKAIDVLAEVGNVQVLPVLIHIGEHEPEFSVCVITALKKMKAVTAAPQVAGFLKSGNPDVRLAALDCLECFDDRAFGTGIIPLVQDSDVKVRHRAKAIVRAWNLAVSSQVSQETPVSMIDKLLIGLHTTGGDDLILLPENPAYMRKLGKNIPLTNNKLSLPQMQAILMPMLSTKQKEELRSMKDIDFSYEVKSEGLRFRANIFVSRTGISGVFRCIKGNVWDLETLGLPPVVKTFGDLKNGLVLVGGPTGSGKSTTLSTIIAYINRTYRHHIISIEDPIEAVHRSDLGLINQREVGLHTPSFSHALRTTLREDPDVILIGELRDLPTIQFAVTAAETGHLVFGTVHTVSADATVDRLINAYPPESQEQVRSMLAESLRAVLCQYLVRSKENDKMVLASEIMLNSNAISNMIRKGKTFQIPSIIMTSREQQMQLMDSSLMDLYKLGKISAEEAYLKAKTKSDFEELVGMGKGAAAPGMPQNPLPRN